jgi:hypothetical protein
VLLLALRATLRVAAAAGMRLKLAAITVNGCRLIPVICSLG